MSSFAQQLRTRHDDLFEAFYAHPFLRSLADGTAGRDSVLHYVGQDNQYLTAYMRCYGAGIAMSPDREWVTWFRDNIDFLLHDEVHPHHVMCEAFGVSYEEAQVERMAPPAQAYIDHMMRAGSDSLGVLLAALLPCPWTYIWAAGRQQAEAPVAPDSPFRGWWEFYAGESATTMLDDYIVRLDILAEQAGPAERERMARAFEDSCHHEIRFWQMAWTQETWDSQLTSRQPV
jgi:thiaminase (transcriptional activator TenA)